MSFRITPNSTQVPVSIVGSSTFGIYPKISSEITYNMFISDNWLINMAGFQKILNILPAGQGRGAFKSTRGNLIIVVINSSVFKLSPTLQPELIGNLHTSFGEVFIDENLNSQICIVDGLNAWIYNWSLPANLTLQSLSGTLIPNYVCYHNTFFLFGNGNTTNTGAAWYAYSFNSATTITQTTQLALQTKPDYAQAVVRIPGQGNNVLVLGATVCEIHTQVGGLLNYQRNSTINVDYGCISVSTIATNDNYVAWLGINERNAPVFLFYSGQGIQRISTDGIDSLLETIQFPAQSTAIFFRQNGHLFYQLTFYNPADNLTLVYDFNTQKFFHRTDQNTNYHPARQVVYFNNNTYFISLNDGGFYQIDTKFNTYNYNVLTADVQDATINYEIPLVRVTNSIRDASSKRFVANSFVMTIDQGNDPNVTDISAINNIITEIGLDDIITETGDNMVTQDSGNPLFPNTYILYQPRIDMSISKDGGVTWSNDVARYMHSIGNRQNVLTWNNMGRANDLTIKLKFWSLYRIVVNQALLDIYS